MYKKLNQFERYYEHEAWLLQHEVSRTGKFCILLIYFLKICVIARLPLQASFQLLWEQQLLSIKKQLFKNIITLYSLICSKKKTITWYCKSFDKSQQMTQHSLNMSSSSRKSWGTYARWNKNLSLTHVENQSIYHKINFIYCLFNSRTTASEGSL